MPSIMNNHRSLYTSFVLLLHMTLLLPLVSAIGNAESPEYTAIELANGTIIVTEPADATANATSASGNATSTTGQEAFVYNQVGLLSTSANETDAAIDIVDIEVTDYNQTASPTFINDDEVTFVDQGYPEKEDSTVNTGVQNSQEKDATAAGGAEDYTFSQQGYLVEEDATVDTGDASDKPGAAIQSAMEEYLGNPVNQNGETRRYLRGT
ncbi:hypothetical protein MPSEU_000644000 [Mayamaea pseudoterrestris]|nr:hypothetical protein MPSEU_000644000 [Mayamaea pseudoterrestris]